MKKLLMVGCLVVLIAGIGNAGQKVIVITSEWMPYCSEYVEGYGFFTEIVSAAFNEAGIDIEYEFYPWVRGEEYVKHGDGYATFPYLVTEERKQSFDFSDPIFRTTQRFFYVKSSITSEVTWERYEDLKPYKIGGTLGYWYQPVFEAAGLKVDYCAKEELGIQKLYYGRFELFAADEASAWEIINKLYPDETGTFGMVEQVMKVDDLRLMVSRVYPDAASITAQFNAALQRIKENGTYAAILEHHNIAE